MRLKSFRVLEKTDPNYPVLSPLGMSKVVGTLRVPFLMIPDPFLFRFGG